MSNGKETISKSKETIIGYGTILGLSLTFLQTIYFVYAFYNKPDELSTSEVGLIITILATHIVSIVIASYTFKLTQRQDKLLRDIKESKRNIDDSNIKMKKLEDRKNEEIKKLELELDYYKKSMNTLTTTNHSINHSIRDLYNKLYENILGSPNDENDSLALSEEINEVVNINNDEIILQKLERSFFNSKSSYKSFLQHFLTNIKKFYDDFSKGDCSIYISIITEQVAETNNFYVKTYYRDPISYQRRSLVDNKYERYLTNDFSPFEVILSNENSHSVFATNDCMNTMSFRDRVSNWNEYYNALITVPIRMSDKNTEGGFINLGFLVVDNKKGNLNNEIAKETLKSYADLLYHLFILYDDMIELMDNDYDTE